MRIKGPLLEDGHDQGQDEEGKPTGNEGPGYDGQGLGGLALSFGLERHVLLLLPLEASRTKASACPTWEALHHSLAIGQAGGLFVWHHVRLATLTLEVSSGFAATMTALKLILDLVGLGVVRGTIFFAQQVLGLGQCLGQVFREINHLIGFDLGSGLDLQRAFRGLFT